MSVNDTSVPYPLIFELHIQHSSKFVIFLSHFLSTTSLMAKLLHQIIYSQLKIYNFINHLLFRLVCTSISFFDFLAFVVSWNLFYDQSLCWWGANWMDRRSICTLDKLLSEEFRTGMTGLRSFALGSSRYWTWVGCSSDSVWWKFSAHNKILMEVLFYLTW